LERRSAEPTMGLEDIDGMFALALWDSRELRLTLARDRVGIKPLYYAALPDGGLVFASELGALLAHPLLSRAVDAAALRSYFFADYVQSPLSMVRGVLKLEPACFRVWCDGRLGPARRYWTAPATSTRPPAPGRVLANELRDRLEESVAAQLVADVPVGVFLS